MTCRHRRRACRHRHPVQFRLRIRGQEDPTWAAPSETITCPSWRGGTGWPGPAYPRRPAS